MITTYERIGITGSPGTGKKTVGVLLSQILKYEIIDLNKLAIEKKAIIDKDENGYIVDLNLLKGALKEVKRKKTIIIGHLLPYVLSKKDLDIVIILRCSPFKLEKRYFLRKYNQKKIKDNIASEILGINAYETLKKFGKNRVAEFDTTEINAESLVKEIIQVIKRETLKKIDIIDWLNIVADPKIIQYFFE